MKISSYIRKNIVKILNESYKWRNNELLSKKIESPPVSIAQILKSNFFFFLFGLGISVFVPSFFRENITTFIMTSLSIFIGLFVSILILVFDKFIQYKQRFDDEVKTNEDKLNLKPNFIRTRNFSRRFVFVLLETLIIAFVAIIFLSITLIFDESYLKDVKQYDFVLWKDIDLKSVWYCIRNLLILFSKSVIIVLLLRFCIYLFFLFSSLGEYMKGVLYDKIEI
ncbi:hypothetical protein ABS768_06320 [Flavobacterium sp. ST-75]|uniref:Uncharacterized protein n=1 Tax=Flavobacterium rhizophilum TaxID=3163296 RepID=A0ABW8YBG1_9FLAO